MGEIVTRDGGCLSFQSMLDEEVVRYAKNGSERATEHLLSKYRNIVEGKARSYFLVGADHDDIIQEGMIGLFKAIRDFRNDKLLPFRAFAELCISRQIFTAIKAATRQKHIPLNSYVSLHANLFESDSDRTLLDTLAESDTSDPEDVVVTQQFSDDLRQRIKRDLSDLESAVLRSHLEGKSYQEIAAELQRRVKSVDNALQRAKRKIGRGLKKMMVAT
ncbi:MAG: RNA polymerase sporulation sigma factor SigH [Armatimonadota bacterium]|nr:MAG: RNA polymerase sporulation sigma factor SigH [Armatimonadota bacterium]